MEAFNLNILWEWVEQNYQTAEYVKLSHQKISLADTFQVRKQAPYKKQTSAPKYINITTQNRIEIRYANAVNRFFKV